MCFSTICFRSSMLSTPVPSFILKLNFIHDVRIDFGQNVRQRSYLGHSDILLSEHLVGQILRLNHIKIPQGHLSYASSGKENSDC